MTTLDARGLSCPEPVIMIKNAVDAGNGEISEKNGKKTISYEIMVDNRTSVENITRFGEHAGFTVTAGETGEDYTVTLSKTL